VEFADANGHGKAEMDVIAVLPHEVIVVEVKLTGCRFGHEQLTGLYSPLLSHIYSRPVRGLQICKGVTGDTPGPYVDSPEEFINSSLPLATWQWVGR